MIRKNEGFTLIEILVSIVLISIISVAVFPFFSNIFSGLFSAGDKTKKTYEAQQEIIASIESMGGGNTDVTTSGGITIKISGNSETTITTGAVLYTAEKEFQSFDNKIPIEINYYKYPTP